MLVPVFGDPNDRVALNTLAELFPEREVVGIYCRDFIWGLGALHCMTQQQPAPYVSDGPGIRVYVRRLPLRNTAVIAA